MINGVVILYNPDITMIMENITSYIEFLEKLYLIDNSEKDNFKNIEVILKKYKNIEYTWLGENKGIGHALNIAIKKSKEKKCNWLLTMDQDSKFNDNDFRKYIVYLKENENYFQKNIGIISPFHKIRENSFPNKEDILEVDIVMTSGNLLNLEVIDKIGFFNEEFFIDEVDHEFCYRLQEKGYKVIIYNKVILLHKLGNIKEYKNFFITNHNYIRRYYIVRNKLYMIKRFPFLKKSYLHHIRKDIKRIVLYENDKLRKLKMCFLAYRDYKRGIKGKINKKYILGENK